MEAEEQALITLIFDVRTLIQFVVTRCPYYRYDAEVRGSKQQVSKISKPSSPDIMLVL